MDGQSSTCTGLKLQRPSTLMKDQYLPSASAVFQMRYIYPCNVNDAKADVGVDHYLTNHTSLQSRFIAYSGSIRRESGRGFHIRPRNNVCRVPEAPNGRPGTPCHVPTTSQPTPWVSAAHSLQHTTNTRNYLQLPDRGQGWLICRAGSYFRAQCMVVANS